MAERCACWLDQARRETVEKVEKESTLSRQGCKPLWIQSRMDLFHRSVYYSLISHEVGKTDDVTVREAGLISQVSYRCWEIS